MTTANDASVLLDEVITVIRQLARDGDMPKALAAAPIGAGTRLDQLGLDSLGKVNLVAAIDQYLGVYIAADTLTGEETLGEIAQQMSSQRKA